MPTERRLLLIVGVAVAYWATGGFGLLLAIPPGSASAVWPPSGVALAALLIGGRGLWPGIFVGSFAVSITAAPDPAATGVFVALSMAIGASLQAVAGETLLRRFAGTPLELEAAPQIGRFLLWGGPVACLIGASWGVATLWSAGAIAPADVPRSWFIWWCGNVLGATTITPLLLVLLGMPREKWRRRRVTVALPLCMVGTLVVLAYVQVSAWERERMQRDFEQLAEPFDDILKVKLNGYLEVMESLRGFHNASQSIDPEEFRAFVEGPLARYPGIWSLSWAPIVPLGDRAAFEARLSARFRAPIEIIERGPGGPLHRAGERPTYLPVDYVEPRPANQRAVGYDALSDPLRKRAVDSAVAEDGVVATEPVQLARTNDERSLLLYAPVFTDRQTPATVEGRRAALAGCYAMVVRVHDLIREAVEASSLDGMAFEIIDLTNRSAPVLLYRSPPSSEGSVEQEMALIWNEWLPIAGRHWRVRAQAMPSYIARHGGSAPWNVLAGGLLFTSLLGGFLLIITGRSHRAEQLADSLEAKNRELLEREAGLRHAQALARSGHIVTRVDGTVESWSETLERLIGRQADNMPRSTREWIEIVHPGDRERFRRCAIDTGRSGKRAEIDYRLRRNDGAWVAVHQVFEPLDVAAARGGQSRWINSIQDVTDQRHSEERIRRLNRVHVMLSSINGLVVRVSERVDLFRESCRIAVEEGGFGMAWIGEVDRATGNGQVVAWHGGAPGYAEKVRFSARPDAPEAGRPACVAVREARTVICNDIATEASLGPLRDELLAHGHRAIAALPLMVEGQAVAVIALFANETNVFDAEELRLLDVLADDIAFALDHLSKAERIDTLAYYDPVTGLANRHLLQDRMRLAMAVAARGADAAAIAFLDLDHFKVVNDSLGHDNGDQLLRTIAQRLKDTVRASDTVARLGGDEFVLLLTAQGQQPQAPERWITELLARVLDTISAPIALAGRECRVSASIGVALYPQDGQDAATLLRNADAAMYRSKELGRGRFQFFTADIHERVQARMELETDLKGALERDEFVLHYQPQVDLRTGRIVGLEALLRWRHPRRGLVGPAHFIGLAEESGLIVPIGEWVMARAAMQNVAWQAAGLPAVPVAVNVSARQSAEGNLDEITAAVLRTTKLPPRYLELELTESLSMSNPEVMVPLMRRLKQMGVELSIDDFGTGYSSMSYLKRFPIDNLKLDQSFVREITTDPDSLAISEAIIGMAHSLRLRVIAEGVETEGQLRLLSLRGCDRMQGYYFSKPLPADEVAVLLSEDRRLPKELLSARPAHAAAVLVLDDDPALLARVRAVLEPHEIPLWMAETPEAAFELLACQEIGAVLCDQRMPRTSGTDFLGKVRQMYPQTRRVLMSAYEDFDAARAAINVGAVYRFLDKSWEPEQLVALVNEALSDYAASNRRSDDGQ